MLTGTRLRMQQMMRATLADQAAHGTWTYRAVRPMPVPPTWTPGQHVVGDCSKGVQYICRWSDAPDPMGNGWADFGNSSTIAAHLQHLSHPSELEVGDPVTFGSGGHDHAAQVMEAGHDPLLWSFGHRGAPNAYRLSWDRREHQLLRLPVAVYVPTPADGLRAKTGYWAWLQWRLGESDWHHHKPADPNVRPNVPRVIPARWWADYTRFLAARKRGNKAAG